jgi:hypothetical protein
LRKNSKFKKTDKKQVVLIESSALKSKPDIEKMQLKTGYVI